MRLLFQDRVQPGFRIADVGCGPNGAFWWQSLPADCVVEGFDLYHKPSEAAHDPARFRFLKLDATELYRDSSRKAIYDLVVADHVFEHVASAEKLARSVNHILKPDGLLHVGIPDATNFTDRFYRLIHPDGGGHVQQFTRDSFIDLADRYGFELIEVVPWPDDWAWLERLYSLERYGVKYLTHDELMFIADVFKRELTPEKGYLYGWEYLFRKRADVSAGLD